MIHQRKILKAVAYAILLCFTSLTGAQPLYAVPANTQVPTYTEGNLGTGVTENTVGNVMDIHQTTQTAVNQWDNFSIGADAAVNFTGTHEGFNSFNYVKNGGPISEIYGQLNAIGGNIFIANPAGVQIGNSAQINVGSLYVTNKNLEGSIDGIKNAQTSDAIRDIIAAQTAGTAQLMSLGSITSATNVTFDGGRIVLDTDRLFTSENGIAGEKQLESMADINKNLTIRTSDEKNVVLGYEAYESDSPNKVGEFKENTERFINIFVDGEKLENGIRRYMWVEDLFQLQAMGDYTNGWFALRNAIDANYSAEMNEGDTFDPIANFIGRFDGLDYHIFGLTINKETESNVGLFGSVSGEAIIRNVTLNGGSITGNENVGSIAGSVSENATIENITNTADVKGNKNVGGVIGSLTGDGTNGEPDVHNFVNAGTVSGVTNIGGIVGSAADVTLDGRIYNLGAVIGIDTGDDTNKTWSSNVGGIAGYATNTTIGNALDDENAEDFQIYNQLGVTGGYNVGGIVGSIEGDSTITNVANHGDVTATGFTKEKYEYHSASGANQLEDEHVDDVHVANVGGIAGKAGATTRDGWTSTGVVEITDVQNDGDVKTASTQESYTYTDENGETQTGEVEQYNAGNVGGIVGSALFAEITNAENSENLVAGAHNVGGIAGYVKNGKIESSQNDGGDITASGARTDGNFATEAVMGDHEKYNIGNIGGIAGYLHGNETKISNSANRGTVHSAYFEGNTAPDEAKTANVGGVVGKVSMKSHLKNISTEEVLTSLKANSPSAIIYNSYNTGDVQGYTGVGGVAGQMVKGSIADSYNLGDVATTRRANAGTIDAVNMGGVVGDTTAVTDGSSTAIYNVYNAGTIGDGEYEFLGRHVGGVVGRLGGALEKAYNTGDIYNGYSVTGGVVGYWVSGNIKNVFNTGNVTVVNYDLNARNSLVGGIVGAATSDYDKKLSFAYNLGTLRSFIPEGYERIEVQNDTLQDGKKVLVSNSNHYTQEEIDQYQ
ncbi:MAG TPA: filamentous hemagglutinin N-terminal domain-containing protein, partial [Candidatus Caccocola faecipullorum]|nr:filamentous hemagglutinin N-terminal domain-containing protein [Candidatus Caccocola faecipullorum]